jgi:hypothetical protein
MALARFQRTLTDASGNVVSGATVTVRAQETNSLASLFSDREGDTAIGNPLTTGSDGLIAFHAVGGAYKITAVKDSFSVEWTFVGVGTAQEYDIGDFLVIPAQDGQILANLSGETGDAAGEDLSDVLDYVFDDTQGAILYRGASGWAHLAPGAAGSFLQSQGAGADLAWGGAGSAWQSSVKAADQSLTSSTTLTDVTDLSFPVEANKKYRFRATIAVYAGAGGFIFSVNGPASPTRVDFGIIGVPVSNTSYGNSFTTATSAVNALPSMTGILENGPNAGAVSIQFRQNTANAAATTVKSSSWIEWQEI